MSPGGAVDLQEQLDDHTNRVNAIGMITIAYTSLVGYGAFEAAGHSLLSVFWFLPMFASIVGTFYYLRRGI